MPRYTTWDFRIGISKDVFIEHIHPVVIDILVSRGINTRSKIMKFISPSVNWANSPKLLPDIQKAGERLYTAISAREKIMIYGDYDADGITASAIVFLFLKELNVPAECYINDRISEGYGMSYEGIDYAIAHDIKLIITVDNGITAFDEVKRANDAGIDVIITDHHEVGEKLPDAFATVDPKRKDSLYPFSDIAGCLVAYKLCEYMKDEYSLPIDQDSLQELVAIGSIADVMPVIDENRIYIKKGLEELKKTPIPGLKALIDISKIDAKKVDTYAIGFILAPRLNAMGRLYDAKSAYELLISENYNDALNIARTLENANRERRKLDREILKKANQMASKKIENGANILILNDELWHEGVIGIVASKITDKFHKPSILFARGPTHSKGSGRSIKGFNLYSALSSCKKYIEKFGGHAMAAGLTVPNDCLDDFEKCMNELAGNAQDICEENKLTIDKIIPLDIIDENLYKSISYMAPFGVGNPKPVFASLCVSIQYEPRVVGKNHVRFEFVTSFGNTINGIFFNGKYLLNELHSRQVDICYTLHKNNYIGKHSIELNLVDIRDAENK